MNTLTDQINDTNETATDDIVNEILSPDYERAWFFDLLEKLQIDHSGRDVFANALGKGKATSRSAIKLPRPRPKAATCLIEFLVCLDQFSCLNAKLRKLRKDGRKRREGKKGRKRRKKERKEEAKMGWKEKIKREERKEKRIKQGRIHGIRCVLARTDRSIGQKRHFCMVSTRV